VRPPQVRAITFLPCNCCIYCMALVQYRTPFCSANWSIPSQPCIQFLFVSSGVCLQLPSDSISQWTPLPSANSSCCKACSGLSPPSDSPCWAHRKQMGQAFCPILHIIIQLPFLKYNDSCNHSCDNPN